MLKHFELSYKSTHIASILEILWWYSYWYSIGVQISFGPTIIFSLCM